MIQTKAQRLAQHFNWEIHRVKGIKSHASRVGFGASVFGTTEYSDAIFKATEEIHKQAARLAILLDLHRDELIARAKESK